MSAVEALAEVRVCESCGHRAAWHMNGPCQHRECDDEYDTEDYRCEGWQ